MGYWPSQNAVVVAHEGTDPTQLYVLPHIAHMLRLMLPHSLSDLTDVEIVMDQPSTTLFPGIPSSVYVHGGFLAEHAKTAPAILAETKTLLASTGATKVILVRYRSFLARHARS